MRLQNCNSESNVSDWFMRAAERVDVYTYALPECQDKQFSCDGSREKVYYIRGGNSSSLQCLFCRDFNVDPYAKRRETLLRSETKAGGDQPRTVTATASSSTTTVTVPMPTNKRNGGDGPDNAPASHTKELRPVEVT